VLTYCFSDYEIGGTFQVVKQMVMIMKVVMAMMIKCSDLEKKKEKNKMGSRQR
jgi:hypothetical protein